LNSNFEPAAYVKEEVLIRYDPADLAIIVRITRGNLRVIHRLLMQIELILEISELHAVTKEVVGFHLFVKRQTSMTSTLSNQPISSPILIGREREVAILQSLIDQVKQGHGQVLLLSGEAGIGKSRLLAEGKRQASEQGFLVFRGICFPTDRSSPYAPLLDLLSSSHTQELLSLSTANPEPLARELARLFPGLLVHASSQNKKNAACSWLSASSSRAWQTRSRFCSPSRICIGAMKRASSSCTTWRDAVLVIPFSSF
jgi:hypothetical protein